MQAYLGHRLLTEVPADEMAAVVGPALRGPGPSRNSSSPWCCFPATGPPPPRPARQGRATAGGLRGRANCSATPPRTGTTRSTSTCTPPPWRSTASTRSRSRTSWPAA
ncbi:hypothetical protein ACFQV4_12090 [Streptomyces thermocarboxydus]